MSSQARQESAKNGYGDLVPKEEHPFMSEFVSGMEITNGVLLWILFGYVVAHLDCNLQQRLLQFPAIGYATLLACCFFLFVAPYHNSWKLDSPDPPAEQPPTLAHLWKQTAVIFVFAVLWIKSKWEFSLATVLVLIAENLVKQNLVVRRAQALWARNERRASRLRNFGNNFSFVSAITVVALVIVGSILNVYNAVSKNGMPLQTIARLFTCASTGTRATSGK